MWMRERREEKNDGSGKEKRAKKGKVEKKRKTIFFNVFNSFN